MSTSTSVQSCKTNLSYKQWKKKTNSSSSRDNKSRQLPIVMATTAGVGGIRLFDIIMNEQAQRRNAVIEATEKQKQKRVEAHNVAVQTEPEYDKMNENEHLLMKWREEQERDNSYSYFRLAPSMWGNNDDYE